MESEKSPTEITMEKVRAEWTAPFREDICSLEALLAVKVRRISELEQERGITEFKLRQAAARLNQCLALLTAMYRREPLDVHTPSWIAEHVMKAELPAKCSENGCNELAVYKHPAVCERHSTVVMPMLCSCPPNECRAEHGPHHRCKFQSRV